MTQYHVGVDLHKTVAQVCVLDGAGNPVEEWRSGLAEASDGNALLDRLVSLGQGIRVVVEALGCNRWFVNGCQARKIDVVVANPVVLGLKKSGRKTDRRDAAELARRLYLGDVDAHARSHYVDDKAYGRRKLLRARRVQMKRRQQTSNQIRALLNAYLQRPPRKTLESKKSREWLRTLELPTTELTTCLRIFLRDFEELLEQIELLDEEIEKLSADEKVATLVSTLPSAGVQTAATLHYELGDVHRFRRLRQASAYAGLAPRVSQSGEGKAHHGPLNKQGNAALRWILSQWAVRLLATSPAAERWASKYRRRMPGNKVRMALARRLLIGVVHMMRTGEVFSLERCLASRDQAA